MKLNLACGDDYKKGWHNVDINKDVKTDQVLDITSDDWTEELEDNYEHVLIAHFIEHIMTPSEFLSQVCKITEDGGIIEVRVPIGETYRNGPFHRSSWGWVSPEYFVINGQREYETNIPLTIKDRNFTDLNLLGPGRVMKPLIIPLAKKYPGKWVTGTPWIEGELTVKFQKISK